MSKYGVISGPYFPAFGLNMERYKVSLCIQSECGKIRTRNNSVVGHFSRSDVEHGFRTSQKACEIITRRYALPYFFIMLKGTISEMEVQRNIIQ